MSYHDGYVERRIAAEQEAFDQPEGGMTLNLGIGPNCPTRCEGCYHFFGNTATTGGLITAAEVIDFAVDTKQAGTEQITLYGGDPLSHPEIVDIVRGLHAQDFRVKLDTVGTAFLGPAQTIYKGRGMMDAVDVRDIAPYVDHVSIPLDVWAAEDDPDDPAPAAFRRGRPNIFNETCTIAGLLREAGVSFGINTVATSANIHKLNEIIIVAKSLGAAGIQIFEFDPEGPNPSARREGLKLMPGKFELSQSSEFSSYWTGMEVTYKPFERRTEAYFMVEDSGHAFTRVPGGGRTILGHITRDRENVLEALCQHNKKKAWAAAQYPEVGVGLQVVHEGKLLLGNKLHGEEAFEFGGFGGVFERLLSFGSAALRDLVEREVGPSFKIADPTFASLSNILRYAPKHFVLMNYVAEWRSGEMIPQPTSSGRNWSWYPLDNLPQPLSIETQHMVDSLRTTRDSFDDDKDITNYDPGLPSIASYVPRRKIYTPND